MRLFLLWLSGFGAGMLTAIRIRLYRARKGWTDSNGW